MSHYKQISGYVAFLDVLGFEPMVERCEFEKVMQIYENALVFAAQVGASHGKVMTVETPEGRKSGPDLSRTNVQCLIISDSVLFLTPNISMQSFVEICAAVSHMLVAGVVTGVPMRGHIACGELAVMDSRCSASFSIHSLVGRPLVRAYREEKLYQWSGCTIADECVAEYEKRHAEYIEHHPNSSWEDCLSIEDIARLGLIVRFATPRKGGSLEQWVINWPQRMGSLSLDTVRKAFAKHSKPVDCDSVREKIANTIAFVEFSKSQQLS